jgi:hypothetical protein
MEAEKRLFVPLSLLCGCMLSKTAIPSYAGGSKTLENALHLLSLNEHVLFKEIYVYESIKCCIKVSLRH